MATGTINMPITKPLPITDGGTGATTVEGVLSNLNINSAKFARSLVSSISNGRVTVALSTVGLTSVPQIAIAACTSTTNQCWYLFDESNAANALKFAFASAGSNSIISSGTVRFTLIIF